MSWATVPIDAAPEHLQKDTATDWIAVRQGETILVGLFGEPGGTIYALGESTRNPRVLAAADKFLWMGEVASAHYDDGFVTIQHHHAGRLDEVPVDVFLDGPVPTLERTELVSLEGGQ